MMHGTFTDKDGLWPHLKGKTALLRDSAVWSDRVLAQFDDTSVPEAQGWTLFYRRQFDIEQQPPTSDTIQRCVKCGRIMRPLFINKHTCCK